MNYTSFAGMTSYYYSNACSHANSYSWVVDIGATTYMYNNLSVFLNFRDLLKLNFITLLDGINEFLSPKFSYL